MKEVFRQQLLELREAMSIEKRTELDLKIFENLIQLPEIINAKTLLSYVSVEFEVDTLRIIKWAFEQGKKVAAPRCIGGDIIFFEIKGFDDLEIGSFCLLEPKDSCEIVEVSPHDICITPALCYSQYGYRIGYGGGYYDRFFSTCRCVSIGICYERFISNFKKSYFDKPVSIVVTDEKIRRINGHKR